MRINFPVDYHQEALKAMKSIIKELEARQVLTPVDVLALRLMASNLNIFFKADEELKRLSTENGEPNKLLKVKNDAQIQAVKLMQDFGLTLRSREKLKSMQTTAKDEEDGGALLMLARQRIKEKEKR